MTSSPSPAPRQRPEVSAAAMQLTMAIIRIAILFVVLIFGAFAWYHARGGAEPMEPSRLLLLQRVGIGVWVLAVAGVVLIYWQFTKPAVQADPKKRRAHSIIAWTFAETAALFGAAMYYFTASPKWFVNGAILVLVSFLLFPVRPRR